MAACFAVRVGVGVGDGERTRCYMDTSQFGCFGFEERTQLSADVGVGIAAVAVGSRQRAGMERPPDCSVPKEET